MPLDPQALGKALDESLTLHSTLCRREAGAFQKAIQGGGDVVVACTQEKRLFAEVAQNTEAAIAPIRFVNIRETGGWSADARAAGPKIAALLAAARLPEPEPVPTVIFKSAGRLLVIGPLEEAERMAAAVADVLDVTLFARGGAGAQERRWPVMGGRIDRISGWLGAFQVQWLQDNPIDLDLCTRCNACVAACPEDAIGFDYQVNLQACRSHRDCVKACGVAGAIDFSREPLAHTESFDLVLDLRREPAFLQHAPPQGYFHLPPDRLAGANALDTLLKMEPQVVVPGHGALSTTAREDLQLTRDYLAYLREKMGAAARDMEPFDEAYARTDWSRFEHLPLFQAANRMNAYNTYLLMERQGQ